MRITKSGLAARDLGGARDLAGARGEHVLAVAGGMDEQVGDGLHLQLRPRLVHLGRARQVVVVEAADAGADGALGASAARCGERAHGLAVAGPDLVVAGGAVGRD